MYACGHSQAKLIQSSYVSCNVAWPSSIATQQGRLVDTENLKHCALPNFTELGTRMGHDMHTACPLS